MPCRVIGTDIQIGVSLDWYLFGGVSQSKLFCFTYLCVLRIHSYNIISYLLQVYYRK